MVDIKYKKLNNEAKEPTRGSKEAAGYDLYANIAEDFVVIHPHETVKIGTGISMEIPMGYFGGIFARSGLSRKEGLRPCNCVGAIDPDYRGEIIVALHNDHSTDRYITPNERIAQIIILPFLEVNFKEVDKLNITQRGEGGFGSTGK